MNPSAHEMVLAHVRYAFGLGDFTMSCLFHMAAGVHNPLVGKPNLCHYGLNYMCHENAGIIKMCLLPSENSWSVCRDGCILC